MSTMRFLRIRKTKYGSAGAGFLFLLHIGYMEISLFPYKRAICATRLSILTATSFFSFDVGINV
jgi:hypothetical protein